MTRKKKSRTKKKKATIAFIVTFLVATSVAIVIPVILASSNSDQQAIKDAKAALEKLTTTQKTVDLTNDANQKLPSEISPTITSMKTLNALIKGVIIVPKGITYIPQVIDTNDIKGEIVVKIKMQKGTMIDTFTFTITGFKKITRDQDVVDAYKELIVDTTIATTTKSNRISIAVQYTSITDFNAKTNATLTLPPIGVSVSIASINKEDEQTVTFTISKGTKSTTHTIIVTKFKKWSKAQADVMIAKAILDGFVGATTIYASKTAAEVTYTSTSWRNFIIKTDLSFPTRNNVSALKKVRIFISTRSKGSTSQKVTFRISKIGAIGVTSGVIVTGFKPLTQAQVEQQIVQAVVDNYKSLIATTIITTTTKPTELASTIKYASVSEFNAKTSATLALPPIGVSVEIINSDYDQDGKNIDVSGEQFIIFLITKGVEYDTHHIIVTGFKSLT